MILVALISLALISLVVPTTANAATTVMTATKKSTSSSPVVQLKLGSGSFQVTGSGFTKNLTVVVTATPSTSSTPSSTKPGKANRTVNAGGGFSVTFRVPSGFVGTYVVKITPSKGKPMSGKVQFKKASSSSGTVTQEGGTTTSSNTTKPLAGATFYGPHPNAVGVAGLEKIAAQPVAKWIGAGNPKQEVASFVAAAGTKVPVMVAYNIPGRDCGQYSAGGAGSATDYNTWIDNFAAGIGTHKAVVILEPDALAQMCGDTASRYAMLNHAVESLAKNKNTEVYIDAGTSAWIAADEMASRLKKAGVAKARGFSINVSNFYTTAQNITYGEKVAGLLGGKVGYVIDTSRNGNGSNGEWCNPAGRALGQAPTSKTTGAHADAYLWIKVPGQSDGTCNGHPNAGGWDLAYAKSLVANMK